MKEDLKKFKEFIKEKRNKYPILFSLLGVLFSVGSVVGISYAAWTKVSSTGNNSITTGTISMRYVEDMTFAAINNAEPMTAQAAYQSNNYFPFQVAAEAQDEVEIPYEITISTKDTTTFDYGTNQKIRLGLKKENSIVTDAGFNLEGSSNKVNYTDGVIVANLPSSGTMLTGNPQTIYKGTITTNESSEVVHNFKLYLWVDNEMDASEISEKYALTININTGDSTPNYSKYTLTYNNQSGTGCTNKQVRQNSSWGALCVPTRDTYRFAGWYTATSGGEEVTASTLATSNRTVYARWVRPMLKSESNSTTTIFGHTFTKSTIESINFVTEIDIPTGAENWDASIDGDGSVMAWVTDTNSNSKYELYIGTNGDKIYAPAGSSYLLSDYSNITAINGLNILDTSGVDAMSNMFSGCSKLTSLDLSNFNTSAVRTMGSMFSGCSSLTSLDLSSFNTASTRIMQAMFYNCSGLTNINISSFNTSSLQNASNMFSGCSGLTSLDLSHFNTSSLSVIAAMFQGCRNLTSINLSSFNVTITNLAYLFQNCSSLTTIDLSGFNTTTATATNGMFDGCSNLVTVYVDSSKWNMSNVTNSSSMFNGCTKIVGGNGTTYNASYKDKTYAHVDVAGNPGYLVER